ncbi:phage holin family protein [Halomonas sp. HP20-15]|uniref:phage holin family protein n=1 Tax=Halomonas sp. HP20-15 TaxID=3085901 RepID=UPI002982AB0B|nr:phage holin family protein [Halomonas sp. HP20-15]MDW5375894.1 phage holin family protein [Halomonas sp. HP20-15]
MDTENGNTREGSSFGSLISNVTQEITALIRNEVELAKAEMRQKASQLGMGVGSIAAGGGVLLCGFLVLLASAVFGLNIVVQAMWLSALIVGAIVVIVGFIMLQGGKKKLKATNLTPDRTMASLQKDQGMAKRHKSQAKEQLK